jgi:hypothetical protein
MIISIKIIKPFPNKRATRQMHAAYKVCNKGKRNNGLGWTKLLDPFEIAWAGLFGPHYLY